MSDEIKVTGKLAFVKGGRGASLGVVERLFTFTGSDYTQKTQQVGFAAAEALVLGEVAAGGWCIIINRDPTNFVSVTSATGETPFAKLLPNGGFALFVLHPSATAPFVQANVAACEIEVLLLEA